MAKRILIVEDSEVGVIVEALRYHFDSTDLVEEDERNKALAKTIDEQQAPLREIVFVERGSEADFSDVTFSIPLNISYEVSVESFVTAINDRANAELALSKAIACGQIPNGGCLSWSCSYGHTDTRNAALELTYTVTESTRIGTHSRSWIARHAK